jgi:Family of unknown function (DUF6299)
MSIRRLLLSVVLAMALVPATTLAAQAAPPTNDTVAGATVITSLPTTITQDTTEATTDETDALVNSACGAPFTNASVWFVLTASESGGVVATMEGSDYSGGFIVTEGPPATGNLVACGPTSVAFPVSAGATYYVVAFSDTEANGGTLVVTFDATPPPPSVTLDVDDRAQVDRNGSVVLSGTYTCADADFADVFGTVTQRVGRVFISGSFGLSLLCDGSPQTWQAETVGQTGLFAGGKAATVSFAFACNVVTCTEYTFEDTVKLSKGRPR